MALPLAILEKTSAETRGALLKWVAAGGTLIVYEVGKPAAESADLARADGALRDLIGRVPDAVGTHRGDRPLRVSLLQRVAEDAVDAAVVVRVLPGTVLVEELQAVEEVAPGGVQRPGEETARVAEVAAGNLGERSRQRLLEDYRRVTRKARLAMERTFYEEAG